MNKLVYICSPYGGKEENLELAKRICRAVVEHGDIPIAPHLLFPQFMSEETERDKAIEYGLRIMEVCEGFALYYNGNITSGMWKELGKAKSLNLLLENLYQISKNDI
jgi:hypothetical protein